MPHIVWAFFATLTAIAFGYAYYIEKRPKNRFVIFGISAVFAVVAIVIHNAAAN